MDLRHYLSFLIRQRKLLAVFALIGIVAALASGLLFKKTTYEGIIFLTIGAAQPEELNYREYSTYETVRAADQFTETIQGWTKNPSFIKKIQDNAGFSFGISARKQEKQNLVISITSDSEEKVGKAAQKTLLAIGEEIKIYNEATKGAFNIAHATTHIEKKETKLPTNVLFGLIFGVLVGLAYAILREYFLDIASFEFQIEEILGKPLIAKIRRKKPQTWSLLRVVAQNIGHDHVTLVSTIGDIHDIQHSLTQSPLPIAKIPDEFDKHIKDHAILFIQLGKTPLTLLKQFKSIYRGEIHPVLIL